MGCLGVWCFGCGVLVEYLLQFIVDTGEEHTIPVMFEEKIAHGFERGASGDEVVEDDAVRLTW